MKAIFEIEWPDDYGPSWMNVWNLLLCLKNTCPNTYFKISQLSELSEPIPQLQAEG
uniref:Uncharacterized protein n=1 Tax=viral metagenome TaxID=1070528 RepID=A0A6H2A5N1_9ZZZZ